MLSIFVVGLQLTEILMPWRHTTNEQLDTQMEVFEESRVEDNNNVIMPGGVDLNSHEDIFNALFVKVNL